MSEHVGRRDTDETRPDLGQAIPKVTVRLVVAIHNGLEDKSLQETVATAFRAVKGTMMVPAADSVILRFGATIEGSHPLTMPMSIPSAMNKNDGRNLVELVKLAHRKDDGTPVLLLVFDDHDMLAGEWLDMMASSKLHDFSHGGFLQYWQVGSGGVPRGWQGFAEITKDHVHGCIDVVGSEGSDFSRRVMATEQLRAWRDSSEPASH